MDLLKLRQYIFLYLIIFTFFVSGFIINSVQCVLYICLKPYSNYYFRKLNYYLCYSLYSQLIFLTDWYADMDIYVHINIPDYQKYFGKEHAFIILNHRYEIDWLLLGSISDKIHCAGNFKAYIKKAVQYFPVFGWNLFFAECVFLERSFEKDKDIINKQVSELVNYPDPIWVSLFPEGTRFTPAKHEISLKIAKGKGLPELKYHLFPRTRGFLASLPGMRNKFGAIYDTTLAFEPKHNIDPTTRNLLLGKKMEAHCYIKRIPFEEIPNNDDEANQFMYDMFKRKDKLQESFFKSGDFFTESGIERVHIFKLQPRYTTLFNTVVWYAVINIPIVYYLLKLLFTGYIFYFVVFSAAILISVFIFGKLIDLNQINKGSTYGTQLKNK